MNKKILIACTALLLLVLFIGCTGPAPPGPYPDDSNWTAEQKECMGNCDSSPQECWFMCYGSCGDGECGEKELDTKSCPEDCSVIKTPQDAICGDGICQELVVAGPYGAGFPDRFGCSVDCWKFLDPDPCGTTIPLSPVINSVSLDFDAPLTIHSFGDFWRNTWATDNKLYTAWGDGEGFIDGRDFHVMGIGAISGTYPNLEGENSFVSEHLYPESKINEKPGSLLAIDDRLYLTGESNDHEGTFFIAYSDDQGITWTKSPGTWDLEGINGLHPNFINMGKNFEFGGDYVYTIISNDQSVNQVYLSRVLKENILDYNQYEFYSGNDTWSLDSSDAVRILPDNVIEPTEIHLTANYHPGVNRYLMITTQNVFDAPTPWGPWTCGGTWLTKSSPEAWQGGYYPTIIAKDLEGGNYQEDYLYFVIAGQNKNSERLGYGFNIGKIIMDMR